MIQETLNREYGQKMLAQYELENGTVLPLDSQQSFLKMIEFVTFSLLFFSSYLIWLEKINKK